MGRSEITGREVRSAADAKGLPSPGRPSHRVMAATDHRL
ncbi:hypothetical protein Pd630_LPD12013 (plasmid) [Rhodococcus opacus PD630]|nr:hypothetical protein Pd630_LPD12013 [Rhodococcus opacus PD630]